jgi:hypothetical protein
MNIEYFETPVPYIIVRNWFNEQELEQVWEELQFLTYGNKLRGPILTNSAKTGDGQVKKHNHGLFLDEAYTDRGLSNILTVTRKLWNPEFLETIEKHHFVFKYLKKSNQDSTLMSYYEDGDYTYAFQNFIKYSSAKERLDNFFYKIQLLFHLKQIIVFELFKMIMTKYHLLFLQARHQSTWH